MVRHRDIFLGFSLLVALAFAGAHPVSAQQNAELGHVVGLARVTYVSGSSVYIDAGREHGLESGQRLEVLRDGLPQDHAYDLVFRHALDIDAAGSTLAFGSTTGSLWVTEDGGDSWTTVSEHLPPVYVVQVLG